MALLLFPPYCAADTASRSWSPARQGRRKVHGKFLRSGSLRRSRGVLTVEGLRAWIVCLSETCVKHQCASEACLSVSTRIHPRHSLSLSGYRRRGISRHAISRVALDLDNGVLVWRQTWCAFQARQQPDTVGHRRSNRGNGSSAGAIRSVPPRKTRTMHAGEQHRPKSKLFLGPQPGDNLSHGPRLKF